MNFEISGTRSGSAAIKHPSAPHILIAENETQDAAQIARTAESLGFACRIVDGQRAFEAAYCARRPTLIVANLYLPRFDGIDLTRWLIKAGNRAPLFLTGHYGALYARAAEALSATGFFPVVFKPKPFTDVTLRLLFQAPVHHSA